MKDKKEEPVSGGVSNAPTKIHKHKELFWIIPAVVVVVIILALILG